MDRNTLGSRQRNELLDIEDEFEEKVRALNGILSLYAQNGLVACNARSRVPALLTQVSKFKDYCRERMIEADNKIQDIKEQITSDEKLKAGYEDYMRDERKKLSGYQDNREKYYTMAKNAVAAMEVKELKKLNSQSSENLFLFLFELLYNANPSQFKMKSFRTVCLGSESDDFQSRLAIFDLKKLNKTKTLAEQFDRIRKANYPEASSNASLNDLLAWMDYIHESYLSDMEATQQQRLIIEQEAKFGERITKVEIAQTIVNSHHRTVNYLTEVLEQLSDVEGKLEIIQKYDAIANQQLCENTVESVIKANEKLTITAEVYQ